MPKPKAKPKRLAKAKPRNLGGRPSFVPTDKDRATVKAMTGYGGTQDDIAKVLGIGDDTLRKYFVRELEIGVIEANTAMTQALFINGTRHNNVSAQIYWHKTRHQWRETNIHEITGAGGGPLVIVTGVPRLPEPEQERIEQEPGYETRFEDD